MTPQKQLTTYGMMAEFDDAHSLAEALRKVREAGFKRYDAYTPYPTDEIDEALAPGRSPVPLLVLGAGLVGLIGGFALQYWVTVIQYPMNVGGRPFNSWPAYVPVTFETTILLAAVTALLSVILLARMPEPFHPLFNVRQFARASQDRFFLAIESKDPKFDLTETRRFLSTLNAREVYDVPR